MSEFNIQREAIIEIVGTQYDGREKNHAHLQLNQKLLMQHQKNNPHDKNAVLILTEDGLALGYIPKGQASLYAPAIDSNKYHFVVEIVKTEPDQQRPILIIKILAELKNVSEEAIEKNLVSFVQNYK